MFSVFSVRTNGKNVRVNLKANTKVKVAFVNHDCKPIVNNYKTVELGNIALVFLASKEFQQNAEDFKNETKLKQHILSHSQQRKWHSLVLVCLQAGFYCKHISCITLRNWVLKRNKNCHKQP